ncbi:hypothetical protein [Helicobacter pylori]|uniref:hypothetical protein n=1 Tax=Helicobacter pylori TaxID=210 RepID=UPI0009B5960B|nr:hypothetical protein [Helicobacter pylori]
MENADNGNECFMPVISSEKDSEIFFSKLKDSSYNINPNLKSYLKDSRYPKNFSYTFHLFFTNDNNRLSIHIGCECVNVDFILENKHINVKHKHREKELKILFFENKQELYNSINKP